MAVEFESEVKSGVESQSRRIDELLASAIEDQAREQRMMIETVTAARKALASSQSDLAALRTLIEGRDQAVVDMLEARLAGLATHDRTEIIAERLAGLDEFTRQLLGRLETLSSPLSVIAERVESLTRQAEANGDYVSKFKEMLEEQGQGVSTKLALSQNSLSERVEATLDRLAARQTEILEAAITELRGTTEEILKASHATLNQDLRQEIQNLSARSFDRLQKMREDIGAYEKTIKDLPMLVDEHLTAHRESANASDVAMSRQLEQVRKTVAEMDVALATRFDKIDKDVSARLEANQEMIEYQSTSLADNLDEKLETVLQTVAAQAPSLAETVGSILQPFVDEMSRMGERVRQTNRRLTESNSRLEGMHESILAYLADRDNEVESRRDAVFAELIRRLGVELGRKDRVSITKAIKRADQQRKDSRDARRYRRIKGKTRDAALSLDEAAAEMSEPSIFQMVSSKSPESAPPDEGPDARESAVSNSGTENASIDLAAAERDLAAAKRDAASKTRKGSRSKVASEKAAAGAKASTRPRK